MLPLACLLVADASGAEPPDASGESPPRVVGHALVVGTSAGPVRIVPVYHATARLELPDRIVWLDPWSEGDLSDAPRADIVLITHVHPDHLDPAALARVSKPDTVVVGPPSVQQALEGVDVTVLANGDTGRFGDLTVRAVPAYNLVRGPRIGGAYHEQETGNGYVLDYGGRSIYFAGDTECTVEVRALIGIDVAFLPMNRYTMSVDEAAFCANLFRPHVVVPYHYLGSDTAAFRSRVTAPGVRVVRLPFYPKRPPAIRSSARSAAASAPVD